MPEEAYPELWQELLDAEAAAEGNEQAEQDVARLKAQVRPGGATPAGDKHSIAILRARIADVVASIS